MHNINELLKLLRVDLDTKLEDNRLDVYSSVNWMTNNEQEYYNQRDLIDNYQVKGDFFTLNCWCDISSYDYFVREKEPNYVTITVELTKESLTTLEIDTIAGEIIACNRYFEEHLTDGTYLLTND